MPPSTVPAADPVSRLGFHAAADIWCSRWRRADRPGEKEYGLSIHLLQGALATPPAPFPLTDLRGQIDIDNQQIRFRDLTAQSGQVNFRIQLGRVIDQGDMRPADFDLKITGLPLDERLPGLLPEFIQKIYRDLQPSGGEADLVARIEFDGRDHWSHDCDLFVSKPASHAKLVLGPCRIDQIQGTMKKRAYLVDVSLQGRAGLQKVMLTGKVPKTPGRRQNPVLSSKSAPDSHRTTGCAKRLFAPRNFAM